VGTGGRERKQEAMNIHPKRNSRLGNEAVRKGKKVLKKEKGNSGLIFDKTDQLPSSTRNRRKRKRNNIKKGTQMKNEGGEIRNPMRNWQKKG